MSKKCDVRFLGTGTKFSRISYGEVVDVTPTSVEVKNEEGLKWTVGRSIFEEEFFTPNQFAETEEVTRTAMIQVIDSNPRIIMTVKFKKKPEQKALVDTVQGLLDADDRPSIGTLRKILKSAVEGEMRTMVGRHQGVYDDFGRLMFTDMEADDSRLRLVDPRTVEEIVVENVKYVLKRKK